MLKELCKGSLSVSVSVSVSMYIRVASADVQEVRRRLEFSPSTSFLSSMSVCHPPPSLSPITLSVRNRLAHLRIPIKLLPPMPPSHSPPPSPPLVGVITHVLTSQLISVMDAHSNCYAYARTHSHGYPHAPLLQALRHRHKHKTWKGSPL